MQLQLSLIRQKYCQAPFLVHQNVNTTVIFICHGQSMDLNYFLNEKSMEESLRNVASDSN